MTHEFEVLSPVASFSDSKYAAEDDTRLISQVEIWSISTRVFETFGVDTEAPILDRLVPQLRRFGIALDTWRANWNEHFNVNSHVGNYPRKVSDSIFISQSFTYALTLSAGCLKRQIHHFKCLQKWRSLLAPLFFLRFLYCVSSLLTAKCNHI